MFYTDIYAGPVGEITLACNEEHLVGLWIEKQRFHGDILEGQTYQWEETPLLRSAKAWLDAYFRGEAPAASELPIEFIGTDFRRQVWEILTEIPYGEVVTYGDIARQIAAKRGVAAMSAQAVGGAVGRNPISILVPCHRVVGAGGNLTGYSGGMDVKRRLLALEGVDTAGMTVPRNMRG